jgi:ribosomal protein S18 acetylase RimI-like enzyme
MNYKIEKVKSIYELNYMFYNDFKDLFDECFNAPPYYLKYEYSELRNIFDMHFKTGFILLAYDENYKMLGFAGSRPLLDDEYITDDIKDSFDNPKEVFYHSDLGVAMSARGNGLAKLLISETIKHTPTRYSLMRTKDDNKPSIRLHEKMGYVHTGLSQIGNSNGTESDNRIYLIYDKEGKEKYV